MTAKLEEPMPSIKLSYVHFLVFSIVLLLSGCDKGNTSFDNSLSQEEIDTLSKEKRDSLDQNEGVFTPNEGATVDRSDPKKEDVFKDAVADTLIPTIEIESNKLPPQLIKVKEEESLIVLDETSLTPLLTKTQFGFDLYDALGGEENYTKALDSFSKGQSQGEEIESLLRGFIKSNPSEFSFKESNLRLDRNSFFMDSNIVLLTFQYVFNGSLVRNAYISFRFSNGQLIEVLSRDFGIDKNNPQFKPLSEGFEEDLQISALAALGENLSSVNKKSLQKIIFPRAFSKNGKKGYEFVQAYSFEALDNNSELFQLFYNPETKELLEWESKHISVSGKVEGLIFQRSPLEQNLVKVGLPFITVVSENATVNSDNNGNFNVNGNRASLNLRSPFFSVNNIESGNAAISSFSNFEFNLQNSSLSENSTFFHLNVARNWAKEFINPSWFNTRVAANVNLDNSCNAFWNGRSVNFFSESANCNNTGEIADVIYHEWGHGLDENTGGIADGAYSEGIGDIVSMLITGSPLIAPGFRKNTNRSFIRNLEPNSSFPSPSTQVHTEGQIIGSTFFDLIQNFQQRLGNVAGVTKVKELFLKSLFTTSRYTDSYRALITLDAASTGTQKGPNFCLITETFRQHGLANQDEDCNGFEEPSKENEDTTSGNNEDPSLPTDPQDNPNIALKGDWDFTSFRNNFTLLQGNLGQTTLLINNSGSAPLTECRLRVRISQFTDSGRVFSRRNTFFRFSNNLTVNPGDKIEGAVKIRLNSRDLSKQRAGFAMSCQGKSVDINIIR